MGRGSCGRGRWRLVGPGPVSSSLSPALRSVGQRFRLCDGFAFVLGPPGLAR